MQQASHLKRGLQGLLKPLEPWSHSSSKGQHVAIVMNSPNIL